MLICSRLDFRSEQPTNKHPGKTCSRKTQRKVQDEGIQLSPIHNTTNKPLQMKLFCRYTDASVKAQKLRPRRINPIRALLLNSESSHPLAPRQKIHPWERLPTQARAYNNHQAVQR